MYRASLLMFALGCGSHEGTKEDPGNVAVPDRRSRDDLTPKGIPRPQSKLKVTFDGKPVEMKQALAWKEPDGGIHVTVSSVPVGCEDVMGLRGIYEGEVTFDVTLGNTLRPNGAFETEVKSTWYNGRSHQRTDMPSVTAGDGALKSTFTSEVDFAISSDFKGKHEIVVKGTIDALGCKAPRLTEKVALPPEMPATIEIAGKKLPIRGAHISSAGDWLQLKLTTGGETCKSTANEGELSVEIAWNGKTDTVPFQVTIGGTLVRPSMDQTFDKKKLIVTPSPAAAGEIELAGDIRVMKFPVKLAGKVTAVECPK